MLTNVVHHDACAEWNRGEVELKAEKYNLHCSSHPFDHIGRWTITIGWRTRLHEAGPRSGGAQSIEEVQDIDLLLRDEEGYEDKEERKEGEGLVGTVWGEEKGRREGREEGRRGG